MIEVNSIKEIFKGHFQVILDFPSPSDLGKILDKDYKYVWCVGHVENRSDWVDYDYYLYGKRLENGFAQPRNIRMDLLIETSKFIEFIPLIHQTIKLIQTNVIPPSFLDLDRFSGKGRYDLLKNKIDYLFELELPGATDYAPIISPSENFLQSLIEKLSNPDS